MLTKENQEILVSLQEMEKRGQLDRARFSDIPIEVYHHPNCPGISSTSLKFILSHSFAHYRSNTKSPALRFGNVFHTFAQEPERFNDCYEVAPTCSKRSSEWRAAQKKAGNRILITLDEFLLAKFMSEKVWSHPEAGPLLTGASFEETFFSIDDETGVLKRCRVDALNGDSLTDLKSTEDASRNAFGRDARKYQYGVSAAFYLEIVSEVLEVRMRKFFLAACEKPSPNEIAVYKVSESSLCQNEEKIREGLQRFQSIKENPNAWRGYPLGQELDI